MHHLDRGQSGGGTEIKMIAIKHLGLLGPLFAPFRRRSR
jgi:hypothetical protein